MLPPGRGVNHGLKGKGGGAQRLFKLFLWVRHEPGLFGIIILSRYVFSGIRGNGVP